MSTLAFILITLTLFTLPMLPAIFELVRPTDDKPLKIVQEYDTDVKHFATGFRNYLKSQFGDSFDQLLSAGVEFQTGTLTDARPYQILGQENTPVFDEPEQLSFSTSRLIMATSFLKLPAHYTFEREVYGLDNIVVEQGATARAILSEAELHFQQGGALLRWAHSAGLLTIESDCQLFGRASSDYAIHIATGCNFERLYAPRIWFGEVQPAVARHWNREALTVLHEPKNINFKYNNRWVIEGDLVIPENSYFEGNLIATKSITIGSGSYIKGSIKTNENLALSDNVLIEGTAVSAKNITSGANCVMAGPVIAEDYVLIGASNVIGHDSSPTTLTAPLIEITSGSIVYGSVWALDSASVVTLPERHPA